MYIQLLYKNTIVNKIVSSHNQTEWEPVVYGMDEWIWKFNNPALPLNSIFIAHFNVFAGSYLVYVKSASRWTFMT